MDKKKANNLLRRIYRALNNQIVEFKVNSNLNAYGIYDETNDEKILIEVNPRKNKEFFLTLIHELLHLIDYGNEKQISAVETELVQNLSDKQLTNLLKKVVSS